MNEAMYRSGGVRRNLELLRDDGRHILSAAMGLEVATDPAARAPMLGAAPPPAQVVAAIELLLAGRAGARAVTTPEDWERQYAVATPQELPWFTEELDADVADAVRAKQRDGARLLDVGTGPGTAAIFAAQNGFDVVATDVSAAALSLARRRAGALPIAWVLDDVVKSRLWGTFDVAVDRGCLHCLPRAAWEAYAASMRAHVAPGGSLVVKVHAPEEGTRHGTTPASGEELAQLFSSGFSMVKVSESVFGGAVDPPPKAILAVLARYGSSA
jgi:SAM-dependent methyltransferase